MSDGGVQHGRPQVDAVDSDIIPPLGLGQTRQKQERRKPIGLVGGTAAKS